MWCTGFAPNPAEIYYGPRVGVLSESNRLHGVLFDVTIVSVLLTLICQIFALIVQM